MIIYSGGPFHYVAASPLIHALTQIPFVIDFRDPWYLPGADGKRLTTLGRRFYQTIVEPLQRLAVSRASVVVNVVEEITELYRRRYSRVPAERFVTVRNGFDEELVAGLEPGRRAAITSDTVLAILGKFGYYSAAETRVLCAALAQLPGRLNARLLVVGPEDRTLSREAARCGVSERVSWVGPLDYLGALARGLEATALIVNTRPYAIGSKVYDYIYLNRPVIAFVRPDDVLNRVLGRFSGFHPVRSVADVVAAVVSVEDGHRTLYPPGTDIADFSRGAQLAKLAPMLERSVRRCRR